MNILIRNYKKEYSAEELSAIIHTVTNDFEDELKRKKRLRFDDERLQNKFEIELQGNGNLLIEYDKEEVK